MIFQKTPNMNQKNIQSPSILQLILCHMKFYTYNTILFHHVCLQPSLKSLFITVVDTTLTIKITLS